MNIGEHVEGCTSPIGLMVDTLLLSFLSPDHTILAIKLIGFVLGIVVLEQTYRVAVATF